MDDDEIEIENEAKLYLNTHDGRALWKMLLLLHKAGKPLPQNLFDKFAEWAPRVLAAQTPHEVFRALDFSGDDKKHKGALQLSAYESRWILASKVRQYQALNGGTQAQAMRDVARNDGVSFASVKKAHDQVFNKPARKPKRALNLDRSLNGWR
jgi:hypothetical protein